eukprot:2926921-Pleurochrysis_carterae.AAC.1
MATVWDCDGDGMGDCDGDGMGDGVGDGVGGSGGSGSGGGGGGGSRRHGASLVAMVMVAHLDGAGGTTHCDVASA